MANPDFQTPFKPDPTDPDAEPVLPVIDEMEKRHIIRSFVKEITILFVGVAIGFVWRFYFEQVSDEAHIIVVLLLIILCMARYIKLTQR